MTDAADLPAEPAYLDAAYAQLDRMRARAERAAGVRLPTWRSPDPPST